MSDLDVIENDQLSINAIINKAFAKKSAMPCGKWSMYTDEEVSQLPSLSREHRHYKEWKIRERSFNRLAKQVQQVGSSVNILEVGCGNGWMAAKLAAITSGEVTGVDSNIRELLQARRVFTGLTNLEFLAKDISGGMFPDKKFDIIVFAGSIQYLPSLKESIGNALEHLTLMGQIHILDSPFHDDFNELESYQFKVIFNPNKWINKLVGYRDPFYHIVIKNRYH